MAGKPGRSGGARPNSGPKPKPPPLIQNARKYDDPLKFLMDVLNDAEVDARLRVRAAVAAAQYKHKKRSDGGKKEDTEAAAKKAESGKFSPSTAPKLVVNNK